MQRAAEDKADGISVVFVLIAGVSYVVWYVVMLIENQCKFDNNDYLSPSFGAWPPVFVFVSIYFKSIWYLFMGLGDPNRECGAFYTPMKRNRNRNRNRDDTDIYGAFAFLNSIRLGLAMFSFAWMFTASVTDNSSVMCFVGLLCFLVEGFCICELTKTGPISLLVVMGCGSRGLDFGLFKYVAAITLCTTQNVFGFWSLYFRIVLIVCLFLVSLHNIIPRRSYYPNDK